MQSHGGQEAESSSHWMRRRAPATMKMLLAGIVLIFMAGSEAHWYNFPGEAVQGAGDMWRAYQEMKESNWKNGDKYFHARGNYDAAQRGPGGVWVAEVISDLRELVQGCSGQGPEDEAADQAANRWGRSGGDPNRYRPNGLPKKY